MKISINWIKEFVDLDGITPEEMIKRFNLSTAEIEGVEYRGSDVSNVVFGKIIDLKDIEGSKNHLLKVDVGDEVLQIVCGAPNARVGMTTCVAKVGANVQGHKITAAKRNDIDSFGMCCGYDELGIGSDTSGIIDLEGDYKLGQDVKEVFPIDDVVFEIDNKSLTNRPDLWGIYGLAREFACIFNRKLKDVDVVDLSKFDGLEKIKINVESSGCMRYSALSASNITVKKSPIPMAIRLNYCGMRDINLLADITNYVMLELGQPMHAFDNEKVDAINVINAKTGDEITTLEGEKHAIPEGAVVIADKNKIPVAIAGIKGGLLSGITDETTSVLFESAVFESSIIRKTSRAVGLITDASQRYEKSLDPEGTPVSLARIIYLLKNIDKNIIVTSAFSDCYKYKYDTKRITVTADFISSRVGENISQEQIVDTLKKLGFTVSVKGENIDIIVPSFRATKDVSMKEDIVEEVARIYGYDNIEPRPLSLPIIPAIKRKDQDVEYNTKYLLSVKYNLNELHSYVWNFDSFNKEHNINSASYIHLLDSSGTGQNGIRSELAPTLIKFFEENKNNFSEIGIYEIGRVVDGLDENNLAIEKKKLCVLLASQTKSESQLFFDMKKIVLDVAKNIVGIADLDCHKANEVKGYVHPRIVANVASREGEYGYLGALHPSVLSTLDKKYKVAIMELDVGKMFNARTYAVKAKQITKFQNVLLDFTFSVPSEMKYGDLLQILSKCRSKILRGYSFVSTYMDNEKSPTKAITIQAELAAFDHTLDSNEIESFRTELIAHMLKNKINLKS